MNQLISKTTRGQCIAEFLGTGLLIFFGTGCIATMKLVGASFDQWEISMIWGMSVTMAVYLTMAISGAHLSPAVTIALSLFGNFDRKKIIPYVISQFLGAFCAASLVYGLYYNLFINYEETNNIIRGSIESLDLAGIFSTYPNSHLSVVQAFFVELIITSILLCLIFALTDDKNGIPKGPLAPLLIGILIAVIGASMGGLSGFALNPARDFGPKTFAFFAGWGKIAYTGGRDIPYFLVPLTAPIIGACIGAYGYKSLIGVYLSNNSNKKKNDNIDPAKD